MRMPMNPLHAERRDDGLALCEDGKLRCAFEIDAPEFRLYHDRVFGRPSVDDRWIFEKICIEALAAGLSLMTVLRKLDAFREVFDGFDIERVARLDAARITSLMDDTRLIRSRPKLESIVVNARQAERLIADCGSLAAFLWSFEPAADERPACVDLDYLTHFPSTRASRGLARAMKARGWRYVGPTTLYAVMQGTGVVNDHLEGCAFRTACVEAREVFTPPARLDLTP